MDSQYFVLFLWRYCSHINGPYLLKRCCSRWDLYIWITFNLYIYSQSYSKYLSMLVTNKQVKLSLCSCGKWSVDAHNKYTTQSLYNKVFCLYQYQREKNQQVDRKCLTSDGHICTLFFSLGVESLYTCSLNVIVEYWLSLPKSFKVILNIL